MQKIIPFLWFDGKAEEAVNFYTKIFKASKILKISRYGKSTAEVSGKPEGSIMSISFKLEGQEFSALNGGSEFSFTPAISFFVNCKTERELDKLWENLSERGKVLMKLGKYPFSEKYGWLNDKYGVSWQLILGEGKQKITPSLMFVGDQFGNAEEAIEFYTSRFKDARIIDINYYGPDDGDV